LSLRSNGLLDSVKQIQNTSQQNGINPQDMMLFMMLMQRQQQSTTTVAAAPPWWAQNGTWIVSLTATSAGARSSHSRCLMIWTS